MRVAIGADHAGFELKEAVKGFLTAENHEALDVGTYSKDPVDYSDYAAAVGEALRERRAERGIILCGSGVGASMAANRIPGIRAGLCHDTYSAHQGVEHDDMNVLVLGGRVVGSELARELIHAFLNAHFSGEERHLRRLAKVTALENRLRALQVFGQSVWLDYIRRSLITSGELRRLIDEDGLQGVTSNPAIFEKAVTGSSDYKEMLEAPEARALDAKTLYEKLAVRDIQDAAEALRPVYERDRRARRIRQPGSVALACARHCGHVDGSQAIVASGGARQSDDQGPGHRRRASRHPATHQRWHQRQRDAAVRLRQLTSRSRKRTSRVSRNSSRAAGTRSGWPAWRASLSAAIDTAIDALIATRLEATTNAREQSFLRGLTGKAAIANAKLAYQRYRELFGGRALAGARRPGRADAALAVGQHGHEESELSRRHLR